MPAKPSTRAPTEDRRNRRTGLWFWTHLAVDHPVFPPYSWLVEHLVLPNFTAFGWLVLVVGDYNMLAAPVLLVVAVLMLAGAVMRARALALTAAVIAAVAALSIYVQFGRTEI
jgi:hypothetical protein